GRYSLHYQQLLIIWRPVQNAPTAALQLQQHVVAPGIFGIHDPDVSVLAGATSGTIGEAVVAMGKSQSGISGLAVSQEGDFAIRKLIAIILKPFASAYILAEDKIAAVRTKAGSASAIRKESQLGARTTWRLDNMNLGNISKARGNEHFPVRRVPIQKRRATKLGVLVRLFSDSGRNRRNVL